MNARLVRITSDLQDRSWVRRARNVAGIRLVETDYAPGLRIPRHWHEWTSLHLVLRGCVIDRFRAGERAATVGELLVYPAASPHETWFSNVAARKFHIALPPGVEPRAPRAVGSREVWWRRLACALYAEFTAADAAASLGLEALASELMDPEPEDAFQRGAPPWLRRARELLHDLRGRSPALQVMATELGVHRSHLARAFRVWHGCTLGDYARRLRLREAAGELAATATPLAQVADAAGFSDQSHFGREFRRSFGLTPARFRALFQA